MPGHTASSPRIARFRWGRPSSSSRRRPLTRWIGGRTSGRCTCRCSQSSTSRMARRGRARAGASGRLRRRSRRRSMPRASCLRVGRRAPRASGTRSRAMRERRSRARSGGRVGWSSGRDECVVFSVVVTAQLFFSCSFCPRCRMCTAAHPASFSYPLFPNHISSSLTVCALVILVYSNAHSSASSRPMPISSSSLPSSLTDFSSFVLSTWSPLLLFLPLLPYSLPLSLPRFFFSSPSLLHHRRPERTNEQTKERTNGSTRGRGRAGLNLARTGLGQW
ncbi:hypothetical protein HETIRDRAFT_169638 [Heterobasidion irregulare TC 32-1]|uniref:Uncharacterized protein n=1 Tax=Heterobasidion irregulare (strain TC 32-1) TaxID=747525 RepID=W4K6C3_HETIT|nr:uncharacterized protein HETIRDRAFT_169638 [Heterobasidion irregulare TC 32-1]ETW80895.1 hypothetical protein HETIRDRAFT_169638 [Heterobasidion irregulare TC 32-1]